LAVGQKRPTKSNILGVHPWFLAFALYERESLAHPAMFLRLCNSALKENVLLGHLIPAGTGFTPYVKMRVKRLVEPAVSEAEDEQAMRADAAEAAEALGAERAQAVVEVVSRTASEAGAQVSEA